MTIPTSILESWSKQGAVSTPKSLREKIERKLIGDESKIQRKHQLDIYLQGSYRNSTNIHGSSDVDVVVQHNATFYKDISALDRHEVDIYNNTFSAATYSWEDLKKETIKTLCYAFGTHNVEVGNKSIQVDDGSYEADVIPCFEYRKYLSFGEREEDRKYIPGIIFYTTNENRPVINFPKMHYLNGSDKNKRVYGYFKPTIRVFKNFKRKLLDKGIINKEEAPSYFIENLLYNVPDECYNTTDLSTRIYNTLRWLNDNSSSYSNFLCQNGQIKLFGNSQEQWDEKDAHVFVSSAINLWNEW